MMSLAAARRLIRPRGAPSLLRCRNYFKHAAYTGELAPLLPHKQGIPIYRLLQEDGTVGDHKAEPSVRPRTQTTVRLTFVLDCEGECTQNDC